MTYKLKGGEQIIKGKLFGWTGQKCPECKGHGQRANRFGDDETCSDCGGTGDEWGLMPTQPEDLR